MVEDIHKHETDIMNFCSNVAIISSAVILPLLDHSMEEKVQRFVKLIYNAHKKDFNLCVFVEPISPKIVATADEVFAHQGSPPLRSVWLHPIVTTHTALAQLAAQKFCRSFILVLSSTSLQTHLNLLAEWPIWSRHPIVHKKNQCISSWTTSLRSR